MKQIGRIPSPEERAKLHWRRYVNDSLLALGGGVLVTSLISAGHLYPRIPTISLVYLLVVVALASTRGLYAASLASLLAVLAFDYFLVPPLYTFVVSKFEDLLTLSVVESVKHVSCTNRRKNSQHSRSVNASPVSYTTRSHRPSTASVCGPIPFAKRWRAANLNRQKQR